MLDTIRQALRSLPGTESWALIADFRLQRLRRRVEAVLVTDRAVLVFSTTAAAAEAAAIDLADFHEGCRNLPILPIALVQNQRVILQRPLPLPGATPPITCNRLYLPGLLAHTQTFPSIPNFDPAQWSAAPYRPVPALLEAAADLYARHDVARLSLTHAAHGDLARTRGAVTAAIAAAQMVGRQLIVFVTGAPGAGKTLCGLDIAFQPAAHATFLTGNPALLHVLRATLIRDAADRGLAARAARQRVEAIVQPLHAFRDHHLATTTPPPDRILVIDEAQRCWTDDHAVQKTRNRPNPLQTSEPAIILDTMARHEGWCAIICLLGGGQEIHAGEGGLAAWGQALATRPNWSVHAPPKTLEAQDPRQRLPAPPNLHLDPALHLGQPVRAHRAPRLVAWVDAVLANDPTTARPLAGPNLPIRLTRSLPALRNAVRGRPTERYGLLASTGARRLRAEGLGGLLWHQDEDAVANWFLDSWPDIRSADALEVAATEFGVQGLELDHTGLCWDADLARTADNAAWQARAFRATAWTLPRDPETQSNRLNAYRVLLTRARRTTTIWVPQGDPRDPTRDPARYNDIANFLLDCGITPLDEAAAEPEKEPMPEPALL